MIDDLDMGPPRRHPDEIVAEICLHYGVDEAEVRSKSRRHHLSEPRAAITWTLREQGMSYDAIGEILGGRDHSSLIYLVKNYITGEGT